MYGHLHLAQEVYAALRDGLPVVALESTLITHGLPYPANRDTALAMEAAVREQGAIPATIAILEGQIRVGLSEQEIDQLAQTPGARKCSRRDIPIAVAMHETAATTVAGTMIIAHQAGIKVFATGGIGGVHRGHPFDISADLIELGRTPVAVVCSGAKSILDLPLTVEVLETQGVPIIGYQTVCLPAFYTRESELAVDVTVESPKQVAGIIRAADWMNSSHGILVAVPVPAEDALPSEEAERYIQEATEEAHQQGIHGKAVTPFVLGRIATISGGRAVVANRALLTNNARVAAQIAKELI
jgi:pseudouridine-5'-phosphate glycosidase